MRRSYSDPGSITEDNALTNSFNAVGIILLTITVVSGIVPKIKHEIGFWKWIFHGIPDVPQKRWYIPSLIGSIVFSVIFLCLSIAAAVNEEKPKI